jgi:hypothetical protein
MDRTNYPIFPANLLTKTKLFLQINTYVINFIFPCVNTILFLTLLVVFTQLFAYSFLLINNKQESHFNCNVQPLFLIIQGLKEVETALLSNPIC